VDGAGDTEDMADTETTASDNEIEEDSSHQGLSATTVRPTLDVVDGAVDTEDMADTESTASDDEIEEDSSNDTHDLMFLTPSSHFLLKRMRRIVDSEVNWRTIPEQEPLLLAAWEMI